MANNNVEVEKEIIAAVKSFISSVIPRNKAVNVEITPTINPNNKDMAFELFILQK